MDRFTLWALYVLASLGIPAAAAYLIAIDEGGLGLAVIVLWLVFIILGRPKGEPQRPS